MHKMAAFSRLCVLVVPLLLRIAYTEPSILPGFGPGAPATLVGRQDGLDSSLCVPSCELGTCGSSGSCSPRGVLKREWLGEFLFSNKSDYHEHARALGKRIFTFNAGSTDANDYSARTYPAQSVVNPYVAAAVDGADDGYYGAPLPTIDMDERAVSQQQKFGDTPFQISSARIYGCTAIVLVSSRGIWMTHLWETYSNGRDADGNDLIGGGDPAFNQRVLMFLRGQPVTNPLPNGWRNYIATTSPGIDVSLFNKGRSDQTAAYIFTPVMKNTAINRMSETTLRSVARYGRNGEVWSTIRDIFVDEKPQVVLIPYKALDMTKAAEERQLGTDARGAVLFQYDPNSDGKGKKAWRLFMENRLYYKTVVTE